MAEHKTPKRTSLGKKFIVLGINFLLTLIVMYGLLSVEQNSNIDFIRQEISGIHYLRAVRSAMEDVPRHRLLASALLGGQQGLDRELQDVQAKIDLDMRSLMEADERFQGSSPVTVSVLSMNQRWQSLKAELPRMSPELSDEVHQKVISDLRVLINDIADASNLILEPRLDTYYLMDTVVSKLPEAQELLPQIIHVAVSEMTISPSAERLDSPRLLLMLGVARSGYTKIEKNLLRAGRLDKGQGVDKRLGPFLKEYFTAFTGFVDAIDQNLAQQRDQELTAASVRLLGARAITTNFRFWDTATDLLERLLNQRLDTARQKRDLVFSAVAFMVLLTLISGLMITRALYERNAAEQLLRQAAEQNQRLAEAVNSASDGILITDPNMPDNPIVYANEMFSKITGYEMNETLGRNCRFLQGPETDPETVQELRWAIQERKPIKATLLNYRKDGTRFWNGLRISPVFSKSGKLEYFLGFVADVTKRKEAEMALISERDYTASIIRGTPAVVCGIALDGTTNFINPAGEKVTGYPSEELTGKNWWKTFYPGEDYHQVEELFRRFDQGDVRDFEMTMTAKNGEKRTVSWNSINRYDKAGKLMEIVGFGDDITDRCRAEEELRKNEEAFRFMLLSAPVMVWMAGPDKKFVYVNRFWVEFTGRSVQQELGDGWLEVIHPDDKPLLSTGYEAAFKNRWEFKMEFRMLRANGEHHWVLARGTPRFRDDGSFAGFIGSCFDIDDRKKLEAQLLQSQKMETVGTLAGGIAHDLNNQLTPLAGYIDLVLKDTPLGDSKRDLLGEAELAARRCAEVVQRLMNFSRASSQKKAWIQTQSMLDELNGLLPKFLPKTLHTDMRYPPDIWPILGNDTELQTVLMNLCTNARDAMPEGGALSISADNKELGRHSPGASEKGTYVVISVKDTGKGIPPNLLQKVFEPFFTTKQKGQGTGLGLSMVFRIVRDHGGWVDLSSQVGHGSVFSIYLPADPEQKGARPAAKVQEELPKGSGTVLFADDEETLRNLGRVFLERLGYQVILAKDGEEAVNIFNEKHGEIAAVVLDMTMPKLTGRQTMKKILEIEPKARILLASGYTNEGSVKELLADGAVDFLQKPYTIVPLGQALQKAVRTP